MTGRVEEHQIRRGERVNGHDEVWQQGEKRCWFTDVV